MNKRRILPLILSGAFILAAAGAVLFAYGAFVDDPFKGAGNEGEDGGVKNLSDTDPNETVESSDDHEIPGWTYSVIAGSVLFSLVFLVGSGNLYLKSKRGENIVRADLPIARKQTRFSQKSLIINQPVFQRESQTADRFENSTLT